MRAMDDGRARPASYLVQADARQLPLADASVQCVVTSPPYWGLRDYGLGPDTLGLEPTPELYVQHVVEVFREVRRVLRDDGTCWVNLGDSYAGSSQTGGDGSASTLAEWKNGGRRDRKLVEHAVRRSLGNLKPKDLVGIPWRVAFALQADGWWLRADIIWAKPNPMPESITDRPTKAHEYLFLLTKSARYYYDAEAIKESVTDEEYRTVGKIRPSLDGHFLADPERGRTKAGLSFQPNGRAFRNRRSVWTIATEPYPDAHFATFPEKLVEPCILAGTSERGACPTCGAPWGRNIQNAPNIHPGDSGSNVLQGPIQRGLRSDGKAIGTVMRERFQAGREPITLGWSPACACPSAEPMPCRVFDPFAGSGTTVAVAERLGRVGIGLELNPAYLQLARRRTMQAGLL